LTNRWVSHVVTKLTGMRLDVVVEELAAKQHAAVGTWQLHAVGLTKHEVLRLRRSGGWTERSDRVLVRTGAPETPEQTLMVAVLDASPGAAVADSSAAWFWGAPGFRAEPVQVLRHRGISRRRSVLAVVHEVVDLHPGHVKVLRGIPVASPARLACDLAGSHPHRAERVLDWLWSARLLDGRTFHRTVEQLAGRGRPGSTLMRELDAARGPSYVPPSSALEKRFESIVLWPMRRQVDTGSDEEWCGRVDYLDQQLPLIAEIQSERYHASLVDRAADAARRRRLEAAGFTIVEIWDTEVWHQPAIVNERLGIARRRLLHRAA
jgi:very-short-patch-repair endonuclease